MDERRSVSGDGAIGVKDPAALDARWAALEWGERQDRRLPWMWSSSLSGPKNPMSRLGGDATCFSLSGHPEVRGGGIPSLQFFFAPLDVATLFQIPKVSSPRRLIWAGLSRTSGRVFFSFLSRGLIFRFFIPKNSCQRLPVFWGILYLQRRVEWRKAPDRTTWRMRSTRSTPRRSDRRPTLGTQALKVPPHPQ